MFESYSSSDVASIYSDGGLPPLTTYLREIWLTGTGGRKFNIFWLSMTQNEVEVRKFMQPFDADRLIAVAINRTQHLPMSTLLTNLFYEILQVFCYYVS